MEALLLTVAAIIAMSAGLMLLARLWPRSSRRTGYHVSGGEQPEDAPTSPEDDDVRWRWRDQP